METLFMTLLAGSVAALLGDLVANLKDLARSRR